MNTSCSTCKRPETTYRGRRLAGPCGQVLGVKVTVDGVRLRRARSLAIRSHSPCGFEWGYSGAGAKQLALALLLDATDDVELSQRMYQWFVWATVWGWRDTWEITAGEIFGWVDRWEREEREREERHSPIEPFVSRLAAMSNVVSSTEGGEGHG
ncbi:MAG TPA: DUF6166 domain-containing protein [Urbifossiella sp.]|nr:DUF6166 domain-containing protein [Urbifossiella sp.]